jgi:hypothetical protein
VTDFSENSLRLDVRSGTMEFSKSTLRIAGMLTITLAVPVAAQQATGSRDVRVAYGSRLTQEAVPEVSRGIVRRLDNRVQNRVNGRLSTRIERYAVTSDPTNSLRTGSDKEAPRPVIQAPSPSN